MAGPLRADPIRIATWNVELARKGPGILLRDIMRGEDPQIASVLHILKAADADVVLLQSVDYDLENHALSRLASAANYPYFFAFRPNSGMPSGFDLDGDGRLGEPEDAFGYGLFSGQGGMALLSRFEIDKHNAHAHNSLLWRNLPNALLPDPVKSWPSAEVHARLPLSSIGHWEVPLNLPEGDIMLWAFHATPPVFDGPEDRNGLRNHDQIRFWQQRLDGYLGEPPHNVVLLGDANQDPKRGEGRKSAIRELLADQRLQDPTPAGASGVDTVDWSNVGAGRMRVSYVLPARHLTVVRSGVFWPEDTDPMAEVAKRASRHRLVWVDLEYVP